MQAAPPRGGNHNSKPLVDSNNWHYNTITIIGNFKSKNNKKMKTEANKYLLLCATQPNNREDFVINLFQ